MRHGQGRARGTLRVELGCMRAFALWALKVQRVGQNPISGLEVPSNSRKHQTRPRDRYSNEQVAMLLAAAQILDRERVGAMQGGGRRWIILQYPAVMVLVRTGIRLGELSVPIWGDLQRARDGWAVRVRAATAKDGEDRYAPLGQPDAQELIGYRQHQATALRLTITDTRPMIPPPQEASLQHRNFYKRFQTIRQRAGIPRKNERGETYCIHSLRHLALDELARVNPRAAQLLAGHASLKTTSSDLHNGNASFVRTAMEVLPEIDIETAMRVLKGRDPFPGSEGLNHPSRLDPVPSGGGLNGSQLPGPLISRTKVAGPELSSSTSM